jgi:energy-coupling factor transporter ATP-binding protein EcfA2
MSPLATPQTGGDLTELAAMLNVETGSRDWKLIVAWLLQALRGTGPYPVLTLTGGQGSGKSTAAKMLRALLDPNVSPLRSLSRDERDLFIAAMNGWALAFDNISGLSQWLSDALCKLSTGGGLSVRELYSDAEETLLDAMRPVVLNGITDFIDKQDLVDRAVQVRLPAIPKGDRKPERELWAGFAEAQPRILGALLDVVSAGLQRLPNTTLTELPRLADFALWATACEVPLGWQPGSFVIAYQDAQDDLIKDALEAEPVAAALTQLAHEILPGLPKNEWEGTAAELLDELTTRTYPEGKRPPKGWPGAPRVLSQTLKRISPALLAQGLGVEQLSRTGAKGVKKWRIRTEEDFLRSVRQSAAKNARNSERDGTKATDARTDASPPTDATVRQSPNCASVGEAREGRGTDATDATDARKPPSSTNGEKHTPAAEWSEDL